MKTHSKYHCEIIKKTIEEITGIDDIGTYTRKRAYSENRMYYYKICKILTTASLSVIGKACNGRDHATVLSGIKTFDNYNDVGQLSNKELFEHCLNICSTKLRKHYKKPITQNDYKIKFIKLVEKYRSVINSQASEILELKKTISNLEQETLNFKFMNHEI